jgi:hypothetical protein
MIYFNINIRKPSWWNRFKSIKCWFFETPFKHKYVEVEIIKNDNLFRIEFEITTKQDHAGCNLELGLLGYEIHFTFYDNRHWNNEEGRWMVYTEEDGYH